MSLVDANYHVGLIVGSPSFPVIGIWGGVSISCFVLVAVSVQSIWHVALAKDSIQWFVGCHYCKATALDCS